MHWENHLEKNSINETKITTCELKPELKSRFLFKHNALRDLPVFEDEKSEGWDKNWSSVEVGKGGWEEGQTVRTTPHAMKLCLQKSFGESHN